MIFGMGLFSDNDFWDFVKRHISDILEANMSLHSERKKLSLFPSGEFRVSRLVYPKEMGNILKIKDSYKCHKKTKKWKEIAVH